MTDPVTPRGTYQRGADEPHEEHTAEVGDITRMSLPAFTAVVQGILPSSVQIYLTDPDSNVLEVRWVLSPDSVDHRRHLEQKVAALRYPWRLDEIEGFRFRLSGRPPFTADTLVVVRDRLAPKPRDAWKSVSIIGCRFVGVVITVLFLSVVFAARFSGK